MKRPVPTFRSTASAMLPTQHSSINLRWLANLMILIILSLCSALAKGQTTYTWNSSSTVWTLGTAWTPTRTTPAANDILVFTGGITVTPTGVTTQTIGKLQVTANSNVTLQSAAAATVLTISGGATALQVDAGSQLNISGANTLQLAIAAGSTGSVNGNMTFTNAAHTITAASASSLTFGNAAVFTAGTGFSGNAFGSGTNNSVIFASGSTYRAQAGANPFQKAAPASVVVFQTGSLYKHQQAAAPSLSGRAYANFEYDVNSTQAGTGTNVFVCDNLTVSQGTFGLNVTGAPGHSVKGNISVASGATLNFTPASASTWNFNGSTAQSITNAGNLVFSANVSVVIANAGAPNPTVTFNQSQSIPGSTTVNASSILAIGGGNLSLAGTPTINGAFQLNQGGSATGGTWVYGGGARLIYNNSSNYAENGGVYWPVASGPTNVTVQNSGGITLNVTRTVSGSFQTSAPVINANNLTANGNLQINTGGSLTGTPVYGASSTLIYNTNTYTTTDNEFPPTTVRNVIITAPSGTNTVTLNSNKMIAGTFSIGANTVDGGKSISAATFTIGSGALVAADITATATFTCSGPSSISVSGSWTVNSFSRATSTVNFTGNGNYNNATSFYNLTNSGGTRNIIADIDVENVLLVSGGQFGATGGTGRLLNMSGAASVIDISGGAINGADAGVGNELSLLISGAQTTLTGTATVSNDDEKKFFNVTVDAGSKLILARGILCKYGSFVVNGLLQVNANGYVNTSGLYGGNAKAAAYNASTGSLIYNTGGNYTAGGEWEAVNSPVNVSIIQPGTNVTINSDRTVPGILALGDGIITTGANKVIVTNNSPSSITNATGYVSGTLRRTIAGGAGSYAFPVGGSVYAPVTINFSSAGAGDVDVSSIDGISANYPAALSNTKQLARHWVISAPGIGVFSASLDFGYAGSDLMGGAVSANLKAYRFNAPSTYSYPATTNSVNSFSLGASSSFGEFGAGECGIIPVDPITGSSTICVGHTSQLATSTPGGVWSSDAPGIASVDVNGLVTANAPGTSTIRYTIIDGNSGCEGEATVLLTVNPNFTITATADANGSISPSGATVFCQGQSQLYNITPSSACYAIADVLVDGVSVGAVSSYTFTNITANHTIDASFNLITYAITVTPGANGTITPGGGPVGCGSTAAYTITPDACYSISDVIVDGVSVGAVTNYSFTNVTSTHTLSATFTLNTYTINASAGPNGSITPSGNSVVNCGTTNVYTITAVPCAHIVDVVVDGVSQGPVTSYSFVNTNANHTISATFAADLPLSAPIVTGPVNVCQYEGTGTQLTYTVAPDPNATSYFWVIPPTVTQVSGQGTNTLIVTINNGFTASANKQIRVTAQSACGNSPMTIYYLLSQAPVTPAPIIGNSNVCPILGTANTYTYTINAVPGATSYLWAGQAGTTNISHPNGAGVNDTTVTISFTNGFTSSAITARAVNGCGLSNSRSLNIVRVNPSTPGLINGPTNVCENILPNGSIATYKIATVPGATLYNWTVTPGTAVVSHPNGAGPMDTVITVQFQSGFTTGSIAVTATNGCGTGGARSLSLVKFNPATPSVLDVIQLQSCPNRAYSYTLNAVPANSTSLQWVIPTGQGASLVSQTPTSVTVSYPSTAVNGAVTVQAFNNCGSSVVRTSTVKLPACPPEEFRAVAQRAQATTAPAFNGNLLKAFPNPTTGQFRITAATDLKVPVIVRLIDLQGREYKVVKLFPGQAVDLGTDLLPGIYLAEARSGGVVQTSRLVKL